MPLRRRNPKRIGLRKCKYKDQTLISYLGFKILKPTELCVYWLFSWTLSGVSSFDTLYGSVSIHLKIRLFTWLYLTVLICFCYSTKTCRRIINSLDRCTSAPTSRTTSCKPTSTTTSGEEPKVSISKATTLSSKHPK